MDFPAQEQTSGLTRNLVNRLSSKDFLTLFGAKVKPKKMPKSLIKSGSKSGSSHCFRGVYSSISFRVAITNSSSTPETHHSHHQTWEGKSRTFLSYTFRFLQARSRQPEAPILPADRTVQRTPFRPMALFLGFVVVQFYNVGKTIINYSQNHHKWVL